ncbi:cathepsin C [Babesia microti strain RI]|uniref:Dipeptidyl peptidase 1 n=2 Tax=Babesia microti TaxID=5868 RepID=A0A1R4ABY8_BABMR|nr:cathepsin C [Babesia microti strain RI]SJK86454.1 cathepsin C [Babesia microti strain RI]|eukprot:XP_021338611.1 cathepsin C [Babesia microti strain RI]
MILVLTVSIVRLLSCPFVLGDLPIHALTNELVGNWKVYLTNTHSEKFLNCGGSSPNNNSSNLHHSLNDYKRFLLDKYGKLTEYDVNFTVERSVDHSLVFPRNKWKLLNILDQKHNIIGHWTMVYDVGLNIRMCKIEAFGYLRYTKGNKDECVDSGNGKNRSKDEFDCYKTDPTKIHIGWARRDNGTFECFYGEKIGNVEGMGGSTVLFKNMSMDERFKVSGDNVTINSEASHKYHLFGNQVYACGRPYPMFKTESLPKNWKWSDLELDSSETGNQGACGSCYALASIWAIEKRFEIGYKKMMNKTYRIEFDVNSLVRKSPYNQECKGGYPFLVGKDIKDFGIKALNPVFSDRFYVKDYNYVGGCYECTNETLMMHEIYNFGPIVAAINAGPDFISHKKGIFEGETEIERKRFCDSPDTGLGGWEFTNHAVAIIGWGESENDGKYWVIKNDWGGDWGVNGYAKVRRGINLNGIESQAIYFDPDFESGGGNEILTKNSRSTVHRT